MTSVIEAIDRNYNSGNRSQKASDIFDEVGASKTTRDAYIKDTQDYLDSLNKYPVGYKRAKEGLDAYNESQGKAGKELIKSTSLMQDFGSGLANVGKTALSIAGDVGFNVLISAGLTAAGKAWDNYSNKQENAIEKGNEALSNYKQTNSTMQEATSWIKDNAERYIELAKGATSLGEQGTLTDAEFKEYNELSAQMATYLPSQIKGYNSLGTAILSVGDSTKQVNNALQSEKLTQYGEAMESAQNVIDKFKAEMYQDAGITKEIGLTNQQNAIKNFLADYDSGKIKDVFGSENMVKGIDQSAYLNNYNLKDSFKAAGIKGSGLFGGYTKADFVNKDNITTLRNYQQQLETEVQTSVDAVKDIMPAFLQSNKDYLKLTSEDNKPEIDSMMTNLISSLDKSGIETISGGNLGELSSDEVEANIRNWSTNLVKDLQKKDTQDALTSLFALDDKKTKMSFDEYEKQADDAVKKVRKQTDAFTDEQLRNSSGIHDTLDQLQTDVDNITSKFSGDKGFSEDKLKSDYTSSQLDALSSIATDKSFTGNWKTALDQMNSVERAAQLSADKMQKIVTTATSNLSTMQTAISESMSNTGVTADTLKSLASAASDNVEGYDFTKKNLFTESAKGIKVNKDALSQLLEVQHKAKSTDFSDAIDKQTKAIQDQNKAVEKAKNTESYDTEKAKLQDMFDDLAKIRQARSQYNALYQQQQEALTDYADWVNAQSTENAGDKYTNMVTGLKNAKELYNKGLVGTDDFKSFAKMISPTGATDVANFEENYNKAKRYLTDNDKGVKNFLNDLKSKGLATYSDSEGWNIGDIRKEGTVTSANMTIDGTIYAVGGFNGNATSATKFQTARKIGNASFDGTSDISLSSIGASPSGHTHNYASTLSLNGTNFTVASNTITITKDQLISAIGKATGASSGFLSASDKSKLDSITVSDIGTVGANSIKGTGYIKATISKGVATLSHNTSGVASGTYGADATNNLTIPKFTVDSTGHITSASSYSVTAANIVSKLGTTAVNRAISDSDGNTINSTYLKLSGGTMTGNISYKGTKATYDMITFIDNPNDTYGNGIAIGGGGTVIIGGGESSDFCKNNYISDGGNERLILANDGMIDFYVNCQDGSTSKAVHTYIDTNGKYVGVSQKATQLEAARNIFGHSFDGTGDVVGQATVYGSYCSNAGARYCYAGLQIRENDCVQNKQSDIAYAPSIGFHWANRIAATLLFHSDGNFYFRKQNFTDRATIDANLNAGSISTTTANIYGTATFTNMSVHNGGIRSGLLHLQGNTSASIAYGTNNPKIKFVNSDGSQIVELMYTDYDSVRWPAGLAVRGNQGNEYLDVPHLYANQVHVDNHCALQYDSSNQCLNFVFS